MITDAEASDEQADEENEEGMQGLVQVQIDTVRAKSLAPMASNRLSTNPRYLPFRGNIIKDIDSDGSAN